MLSIAGLAAVSASALLIAAADSLIKRMSLQGSFLDALRSPWMIAVLLLYFVQILLAIYVFINRGELALYGNLFIVFYSILMVLAGVLLFREQLSYLQIFGVLLALSGAVLLNSGM